MAILVSTGFFRCLSLAPVACLTSPLGGSVLRHQFITAVHPKLEPDTNQQSANPLRVILLTLNQSAIQNEISTVPPVQEHPLGGVIPAAALMYASLMPSLLVAFVVIMGKQWTNRYMRRVGRSMTEKRGDCRRRYDGLGKVRFDLFIDGLSDMPRAAALFLICGLCQHVGRVSIPDAGIHPSAQCQLYLMDRSSRDRQISFHRRQAWVMYNHSQALHDVWPRHLTCIQHAVSTSQRLRQGMVELTIDKSLLQSGFIGYIYRSCSPSRKRGSGISWNVGLVLWSPMIDAIAEDLEEGSK